MAKNLTVVTPAASTAVTRAQCALFMRYVGSLQNDVIDSLIYSAEKYVEQWIGKTLVDTTYTYYFDSFNECLDFPIGNVSSITSVEYIDSTEAYVVLSNTVYDLDNKSIVNKITLKYGQEFPTPLPLPNAVRVTFVAGFGDASDVPEPIKTAVKIMVASMFEFREGQTPIYEPKENPTIKQLMNTYTAYNAW